MTAAAGRRQPATHRWRRRRRRRRRLWTRVQCWRRSHVRQVGLCIWHRLGATWKDPQSAMSPSVVSPVIVITAD